MDTQITATHVSASILLKCCLIFGSYSTFGSLAIISQNIALFKFQAVASLICFICCVYCFCVVLLSDHILAPCICGPRSDTYPLSGWPRWENSEFMFLFNISILCASLSSSLSVSALQPSKNKHGERASSFPRNGARNGQAGFHFCFTFQCMCFLEQSCVRTGGRYRLLT